MHMSYSADDLQQIDPVEYVRANPEMFSSTGVPNPATIANDIALDALVLGARNVRVFRFSDWWVVCADVDWLRIPCQCSAPPRETFTRLLGFPELAVNSHRHEIVATAYAHAVVSHSTTDSFVVSGDVPRDDKVWERIKSVDIIRAIAFRMSS